MADQIGLEDNKSSNRAALGIERNESVIVLMPGSRAGEIKRLAPTFFEAAINSLCKHSGLRFIIPFSGIEAKAQISNLMRSVNIFESEQFRLIDNSHKAISAADLVVMASGTATLESLLLRRPMIICYKLAPITYAIGSRLLKIPYVGLPNLLAGQKLIPEYLQKEVSVNNLVAEIDRFIKEPGLFNEALRSFEGIHKSLRGGASE